MEKKRLPTKWIVIAAIALIAVIIVLMNHFKQNSIKQEIVEGYSEIMGEVLDEYLSGTGTDKWGNPRKNEYAIKMGLEEINYEIVEIITEKGSHDDKYVLDVEIQLICEESGSNDDRYELANEVFWTFYDIQSIISGIEIGEYECSYYPTEDPEYSYEDLITIFVNGEKIIYPEAHEPDNNDTSKYKDTVKCEVCGKRYNKDSDNASSIARTNMCSSCYKDFKATKDAIDAIKELPVN